PEGLPGAAPKTRSGRRKAVIDKDQVRHQVYAELRRLGAARFPFPIEGRLPNFKGAEAAARQLRRLDAYRRARGVKVNPDPPQRPVRDAVLADGKSLYIPTPRLRGAFLRIDPRTVPPGERRRAAPLTHAARYGQPVSLADLARERPPIDLIVTG